MGGRRPNDWRAIWRAAASRSAAAWRAASTRRRIGPRCRPAAGRSAAWPAASLLCVLPGLGGWRRGTAARAGANRLIQEGATLVRSAEDVLEALNLRMVAQQAEAQAVLTSDPVETAMLKAISHEPTHIDDIVRSMNLTV